MKIIPYEEKYREDMHAICIDTGSQDNKVNKQHHDFSLLMYCDPYLDHGRGFILLDEEDHPQGYILCADDGEKFFEEIKPYFQKIKEVAPDFYYRCDVSGYQKYVKEYPAHLHIDIRETYTGNGSGKALMKTLLDSLQKDGVLGIMVGVSSDNPRAYNFYKKMGFQVLEAEPYGYLMGRKL